MTILFITSLAVAGIIGYYFLIFKPTQDAKISTKDKGTAEVVAPAGTDQADAYSEIINDYPTYHRQDGVK